MRRRSVVFRETHALDASIDGVTIQSLYGPHCRVVLCHTVKTVKNWKSIPAESMDIAVEIATAIAIDYGFDFIWTVPPP